jgi:hypothetical protein
VVPSLEGRGSRGAALARLLGIDGGDSSRKARPWGREGSEPETMGGGAIAKPVFNVLSSLHRTRTVAAKRRHCKSTESVGHPGQGRHPP